MPRNQRPRRSTTVRIIAEPDTPTAIPTTTPDDIPDFIHHVRSYLLKDVADHPEKGWSQLSVSISATTTGGTTNCYADMRFARIV
jgi:hypothetical protein